MRQMAEEQQAKRADLVKQTQFPVDNIDIDAFLKIAYGDIPADEAGENKAIRSGFQAPRPPSQAGASLNY
jgi:hypothetical protein